jgi:ATP-binding cassette subfamily D (ALD) protein 3
MVIGWYLCSGIVLRFISPPFGKLTALEQRLEGEYRQAHNELISHSEEIAFYNGSMWEKKRINESFRTLYNHIDSILYKKIFMGVFDSMVVKYGAVAVGYTVLGLPVFGPNKDRYNNTARDSSDITRDYIRNSSLLINLAKAIGRIVVSYKEL